MDFYTKYNALKKWADFTIQGECRVTNPKTSDVPYTITWHVIDNEGHYYGSGISPEVAVADAYDYMLKFR